MLTHACLQHQTGEFVDMITVHDEPITDLQWSPDRTYFVTSSKDKVAKVNSRQFALAASRQPAFPHSYPLTCFLYITQLISADDLTVLKSYVTDTPLNSAAIAGGPKDFILLGGGQAAHDVTTTSSREGRFETRVFHKIFEEELGRIKGHFGPVNYIAISPDGKSFCTGGEDGMIRLHHFDPSYFEFQFEVEREKLHPMVPLLA